MLLPKNPNGCPFLLLAPMEGVGDRAFRQAMASIGGFNEAVTDFIRVPSNAHVKSLARVYEADELGSIPLAAQLMGADPELMAEMAQEMAQRGAPRIDLNCGCPSHRVTGRGAGSSLLKDPEFLYEVAAAMVKAVSIPVTIKMRAGYADITLFKENLCAAQESGARYITLHPRTKVDGYGPPARWELIAEAKALIQIPVVGNGDILTVEDACVMLKQTGCDGLMIGRGSIANPFLFRQIQAHFSAQAYVVTEEALCGYVDRYMAYFPQGMTDRTKVNKLKQLLGCMLKGNAEARRALLTSSFTDPQLLRNFARGLLCTR